jgi:hypothetical protein
MDEYRRKAEEIKARLDGACAGSSPRILLGEREGVPFYLSEPDLDNSIHIMGATREGKSKQLQNIFRQMAVQGIGGCLIDPHGYLYDDLVADCSYLSARHPKIMERVVLFDPGDDENIVGFNTLRKIGELDLEMQTLSRMYATLKARGKDNFDDFPTAKVWLQNIFTPLIDKGLTLMEARYLIDRGGANEKVARAIVENCNVDLIEHDWEWYRSASKKTQYEELLSSINMLRNFVTNKRLELIFGRLECVLDLRKIMDEGKLLLVNLGGRKLHADIARLMGTLLVNEFFLAARTRPDGSKRFFLAIDEFENYVTQDIADILDQGHKFGMRLILAHHSLEQVREQNRKVYASVMQNAKIKIVYGGLTYDNAEILAKEMFAHAQSGGLDPLKIKRVQESPYLDPNESTRVIQGKAESSGDFSGIASTSGWAYSTGETSFPVDPMLFSEEVIKRINSQSSQQSESRSSGNSYSDSLSEVVVPFVEQNLKWYVSNIQYMPLEEQLYQIVARMKNLPQQVCMVKLPKSEVMSIKTSYVEEYHRLENEIEQFSAQLNAVSPYHMRREQALDERKRITASLIGPVQRPDDGDEPDDERWE